MVGLYKATMKCVTLNDTWAQESKSRFCKLSFPYVYNAATCMVTWTLALFLLPVRPEQSILVSKLEINIRKCGSKEARATGLFEKVLSSRFT